MLAIRLQRVGRSGYPTYRLAVQEAQRHPSSGRVIAYVGSYNPHTKATNLNTEKIELYLSNGAQPTPRVVRLLKDAKIKLPSWVKVADKKHGVIRHSEKLRKNRLVEEVVEETPVEVVEEVVTEAPAEEAAPADETPAE